MNILIQAYLFQNLGDDLFIKILLDRYPKHTFLLNASDQYRLIFKDSTNYKLFNINYRARLHEKIIIRLLRTTNQIKANDYDEKYFQYFINKRLKPMLEAADLYLIIGGSLFIQKGEQYIKDERLERYKSAVKYYPNVPKLILGANFGPFKDKRYFLDCHKLFEKFNDICFRDRSSYDLFSDLSQVRYAPDIVFNLNTEKYKTNSPEEQNVVGISFVPFYKFSDKFSGLTEEKYNEILASVLQKLESIGLSMKLFSFSAQEGDEVLIEKLIQLSGIKTGSYTKVFYHSDVDFMLEQIASVSTMICSRFHALILAILFGKKIIPICYSNKMVNLLEDINFGGKVYDLKNLTDILSDDLNDAMSLPDDQIQSLREASSSQFKLLDQLLN